MKAFAETLSHYYALTKPGIIYGNLLTAFAGFALASKGQWDTGLMFATLLGSSLIVASGCVFNNYIDRDIDKLMGRTKNRPLATGALSLRSALVFGTLLAFAGSFLLFRYANVLALAAALVGLFFYVVVYSLWSKRYSVHGTLVGSVSGAMPPVIGYCAASNVLDGGGVLLFLVVCLWQMPHSFAIAIYRIEDYIAASIPVLPVKKGIRSAKIQIVWYIAAFVLATLLLTVFGYAGYLYAAVMGASGIAWLMLSLWGWSAKDERSWARNVFLFSLAIIVLFSAMLIIDPFIAI